MDSKKGKRKGKEKEEKEIDLRDLDTLTLMKIRVMQEPIIMNTRQTAELLGITKQTVWKWIKAGNLPATKIGKRWFVSRDDLLTLIQRGAAVRDE